MGVNSRHLGVTFPIGRMTEILAPVYIELMGQSSPPPLSIPLSKYSFILPTVCFFSRPQVVVLKDSLLLACKTYRDSIPLSKYSFILPTVCFFSRPQVVVLKDNLLLAYETYRDSISLSKYSFILPTVCFFSRPQVVALKVFYWLARRIEIGRKKRKAL
jgi:hypothetical protein